MTKRGWEKIPLADVCEINPRFSNGVNTDKQVSFVPMAAIEEKAGKIVTPEVRTLRDVIKGYTSFQNGDVLFAKITPCMENGKAAIARDLVNGIGFGSTEFHVLRPHENILAEWVFAFVRQESFRNLAAQNFTGTAGQQRVPADFIKRALIPLPPLPEQQRIVRILDEADTLRQLRARADARTNDFIPALFNEMFGDPGTNPKGWNFAKIGDVLASVEFGISEALSQNAEFQPDRIAVLRIANITGEGNIDFSDLRYLKVSERKRQSLLLTNGDLLFNWRNSPKWIGKTAIFESDIPCIFASFLYRLRIREDLIDRVFLWFYLNQLRKQGFFLSKVRQAVSQANYGREELAEVKIILPPLALQREFAARVAEVRALQAQQARSRERLEDLFQALLHRAFSGEL